MFFVIFLFPTVGCSLRLFGSSKSGLGLKTSDINIYLDEENEVQYLNELFTIYDSATLCLLNHLQTDLNYLRHMHERK